MLKVPWFSIVFSFFIFSCLAQKGTKGYKLAYTPDAIELNKKGYELSIVGKHEEAFGLFLQAIKLNDIDVTIYENLFIECGYLNNYDTLKKYYDVAVKLFDKNSDVFYFSGESFKKLKKFNEAIESYNLAINRASTQAELLYLYYFNRGNTFLKLKKYNEAIVDYDKTLRYKKKHFGSYTNKGFALMNLGRKDEACILWRKTYRLGSKKVLKYIQNYCK